MLHIIKSFDDAVIINAKEKGATQAIGEGTYALQASSWSRMQYIPLSDYSNPFGS